MNEFRAEAQKEADIVRKVRNQFEKLDPEEEKEEERKRRMRTKEAWI